MYDNIDFVKIYVAVVGLREPTLITTAGMGEEEQDERCNKQSARYLDCGAYVEFCNFFVIVEFFGFKNDLNAFEAASVIKLNKSYGL